MSFRKGSSSNDDLYEGYHHTGAAGQIAASVARTMNPGGSAADYQGVSLTRRLRASVSCCCVCVCEQLQFAALRFMRIGACCFESTYASADECCSSFSFFVSALFLSR
jgi:hypothetical protein